MLPLQHGSVRSSVTTLFLTFSKRHNLRQIYYEQRMETLSSSHLVRPVVGGIFQELKKSSYVVLCGISILGSNKRYLCLSFIFFCGINEKNVCVPTKRMCVYVSACPPLCASQVAFLCNVCALVRPCVCICDFTLFVWIEIMNVSCWFSERCTFLAMVLTENEPSIIQSTFVCLFCFVLLSSC